MAPVHAAAGDETREHGMPSRGGRRAAMAEDASGIGIAQPARHERGRIATRHTLRHGDRQSVDGPINRLI
jgi:hypothetical protein